MSRQHEQQLDKLIIVTGTTGLNISNYVKRVIEELKKYRINGTDDFKTIDFEKDYLLSRESKVKEITLLLGFDHLAKPAFNNLFERAFNKLVEDISTEEKKKVILLTHISYVRSGSEFIPNPLFLRFLSLSKSTKIVYLFDDWYDVLERLHKRMKYMSEKLTPGLINGMLLSENEKDEIYPLDPLVYLTWRLLDINLLNEYSALRSLGYDIEMYIFALKHPRETHVRFFDYLLNGDEKAYIRAYVSHPISVFRRLRKNEPLHKLPGVCNVIEKAKRLIIKNINNIILFEPTTIDEYVNMPASRLRKILEEREPELADLAKLIGGCENAIDKTPEDAKTLSIVVECEDRWPVPDPDFYLDAVCKDQKEACDSARYATCERGCEGVDSKSHDVSISRRFVRELFINLMLGSVKDSYVLREMERQIVSQIVMRDFLYIEQSHVLIVLIPLFYKFRTLEMERGESNKSGEKQLSISLPVDVVIHLGNGVMAEVQRALARAKVVINFLLPTPWDELYNIEGSVLKGSLVLKHLEDLDSIDEKIIKCLNKHGVLEYEDEPNCNHEIIATIYERLSEEALEKLSQSASKPFALFSSGTSIHVVKSKKDLITKLKTLIATRD